MLNHLGYVAINLTLADARFRTCRLANATPDRLRDVISANLATLEQIIHFNIEHDIHLYRISSDIIPFASHPANTLAWWDEFSGDLARIGSTIRAGDIRVSMHPGQYAVLNSPRSEVVENAVKDLAWHCRFLDALDVDTACKVNIHVGGVYGDKQAAIERFNRTVLGLDASIRRRLTIENDERSYTARDVLTVSAATGLPVMFDWLHHHAHVESKHDVTSVAEACFATWRADDGVPKTHYSTQAVGQRTGAHAEYVDIDDFITFLAAMPDQPFDCMLEAKGKDLALFRLRDDLRDRSYTGERDQDAPNIATL